MKRFAFTILSTVFLLGSCSIEELEDIVTIENNSIGFWSYVGSSTRAIDIVEANFQNFGVTAYLTDENGSLTDCHIPRTTVSREVLASDAWVIEDGSKYYWPINDKLSFFAFYPTKSTPFIAKDEESTEPYVPTIVYEANKWALNQPDFIAASALEMFNSEESATASAAVNLTFSHIMSKVNFSIVGAYDHFTYTVTNISITAHDQGTFVFDLGNDDSESKTVDTDIEDSTLVNSTIGAWIVDTEETEEDHATKTFEYFNNEDDPMVIGPESESGAMEMTLSSDYSFMMIPQTLPADAELSVTYRVSYNNVPITYLSTKYFSMADYEWGMGSNTLYKIILPTDDLKVIELEVGSIDSWTEEKDITIYTGPLAISGVIVNEYFEEANFNEEDAGLNIDILVNEFDDEESFNEAESGVVGDVTVDDYNEKDEYGESEGGVVGDVTVGDYDEKDDYGESEGGVVGDVTVGDYDDTGEYGESEGGVIGDVGVGDYSDSGDYGESEGGVIGDVGVGDYSDSGNYGESEGGVIGDVGVGDYSDSDSYGESDGGVIGDVGVDDYSDTNAYGETEGGVIGGVDIGSYADYDSSSLLTYEEIVETAEAAQIAADNAAVAAEAAQSAATEAADAEAADAEELQEYADALQEYADELQAEADRLDAWVKTIYDIINQTN